MFERIVSVVLIAAVFGCPISCCSGVCHAGACGLAEQPASPPARPHCKSSNACCDRSSNDGEKSPPTQCPNQSCPNKSCQGICGGAVFENPLSLDDLDRAFFLPLIDAEASIVARMASCQIELAGDGDPPHCDGGGNLGSSLRILHMSLLR